MGFKGRSCIKQYIPKKPIKRRFKIWVRADSHNGYICQFDCYTGKTAGKTEVGLGGVCGKEVDEKSCGKGISHFYGHFFLV